MTGFTLRSQTRRDQVSLHVVEADARISLVKLLSKTIHIRGVDAREVDFRYRERLDGPPGKKQEEQPEGPPENLEYWPEIPGLTNPPDPRPEDLYTMKKKKRPWAISITGVDVQGPVSVAFNDFRFEGDGSVGGGVTVKPRDTIRIHRGRLALENAKATIGPTVVADGLAIHSDLQFRTFPARGAKFADVLGGISGSLSLAGVLSEKAAIHQVVTPGIMTFGAGTIDADLEFKRGVMRAGSHVSLESDVFHIDIMGLVATGTASVSSATVKERGEHVTRMKVNFEDFEIVDPESEAAEIVGSGLRMDARWDGFSLAGDVPASAVEIVVPRTEIRDVGVFNALIPEEGGLALESGAGELEARLEVDGDRIAVGNVDLVAHEIVMTSKEVPIHGDLEVHATLAKGDLTTGKFDLSGTTIRLDNMVGEGLSERKQETLDAWFCDVELQSGAVTFGKPMSADGRVKLQMRDTRPLVALLKDLGVKIKALSLMPNVKGIDGEFDLGFGRGFVEVEDLTLTGKSLEVLGWLHLRDKKADGRLFTKYGILAAGVAIDQGKAKIHLSKSRKWFEDQGPAPGEKSRSAASGGS